MLQCKYSKWPPQRKAIVAVGNELCFSMSLMNPIFFEKKKEEKNKDDIIYHSMVVP